MSAEIERYRAELPATIDDLAKYALIGRDKLQAVRAEISAIKKVGLASEVLEQKRAEAQEIAEIVTLSELRIGEMLLEIPKATPNNNPFHEKQPNLPFVKSKTEKIAEAGIPREAAKQYQQMAAHPDLVEQAIAEARENDDIVSRSAVLKKIQDEKRREREQTREVKREKNAEQVKKLHTPLEAMGLFSTIVVDPPWDWGDEGDVNQMGRARPDYATMPISELESLPIGRIAAEDAHLYLWVTNRSLPKAFSLIEAWGFRYITCITWVKPTFGMGNYFRGQTEQLLFGVRGSLALKRKDAPTVLLADRGKGGHSSKPTEAYDLIESCSHAPYIDVFGRIERNGWSVWGQES